MCIWDSNCIWDIVLLQDSGSYNDIYRKEMINDYEIIYAFGFVRVFGV